MLTSHVPVDEGEVEAQPDLPPLTITLMHEGGQQAAFPWTVRFHVPLGGSLRKAAAQDYLRDCATRWAEGMDYAMVDGTMTKAEVDGTPSLTLTATVTGYRDAEQ